MAKNENSISVSESGLDEVRPELDADWFEQADAYEGARLARRGRPPSEQSKRAVSLRLDPDVISWFKQGGVGWQSRMNAALRTAAGL